MSMLWTTRDLDIVETLTRRVRLLSIAQVARIWWPDATGHRVARRRIRKLTEAGLIERRIVNVRPFRELNAPLACWTPGDDEPDCAALAEQTQSRFTAEAIPLELVSATKLAANLFGSSAGRFPAVHQRDHDLLLAQVYVLYRTTRSPQAAHWRGEDSFSQGALSVRADAFIVDRQHNPVRAVESAGRARRSQLATFHTRCAQADIPYELW